MFLFPQPLILRDSEKNMYPAHRPEINFRRLCLVPAGFFIFSVSLNFQALPIFYSKILSLPHFFQKKLDKDVTFFHLKTTLSVQGLRGLDFIPEHPIRFRSPKSFRRSAKIVFLHGATGGCGGAKMQFLHSGTVVKPYPGGNFSICWDSAVKNIWQYLKILLDLSENLQIKKICHSPFTDSAARKVPGGVQKLYFCTGQQGDAAMQKCNFCTPGQS